MHAYDLILTLTGGLTAALALGYVTHRLGLSPIAGYLLAGTLVGPHTPGFVADTKLAEQLAEIGVILLMFGVGLQFHVEELLAVRRVAVPGAVAQSVAATALGAVLAHWLGWSWPAGIVFGMALAVASTVVLIRVLADHNQLHTQAGHIAVGWLVVEDLFTVIALVLLPALFGDTGSGTPLWLALLTTALKVGALVAFTAIVGTRAIPTLLDHVAHTRSRELFTLTVLVLALGIAVGSSLIFSVSMALGAFLAGMVVGRSDYSLRAAADALPMRDAFAVLFFVSVGMLLDPAALVDAPAFTLGALVVILIAKPLVAFAIVWVMRYPLHASLTVAIALAQIGEFSFILSTIGRDLGLLTPVASNALVAASIVSIVLNPLLYRLAGPFELNIVDGSYAGVDLWYEIERALTVAQGRAPASRPAAPQTPFDRFSTTGRLAGNVLDVQRFDLVNPYLAARGKGKVDYRAVTGDLTLVARLLKTPEGNVAGLDLSHLADVEIPVTVRGPLADPKVRPDIGGLLESAAKQQLRKEGDKVEKKLKDKVEDALKDLLGQ